MLMSISSVASKIGLNPGKLFFGKVHRLLGPKMAEHWRQQVVVDNRPSAGGTVAGTIVATAAADGHTLLVASAVFAGGAAL